MASSLVRELIDAGIHFGHRVSRWNPKMAPYIFGRRNSIHIIDIKQTVKGLLQASRFVSQTVADGNDVLFVGTKRQARQTVQKHAGRCGMHYVSERWLGGTLTNFRTIRSRLARLEELEGIEASGEVENYSKKMKATIQREQRKIFRNLAGIRRMERLPAVLIIIDVKREHIALKEARKLHIPTICLIDTDGDPDYADIPIPGNDDAMRSVELVVSYLADAVEAGKKGRLEAPSDPQAPRRRSRRPTTARADEEQSTDEPAATSTVEQQAEPPTVEPAATPTVEQQAQPPVNTESTPTGPVEAPATSTVEQQAEPPVNTESTPTGPVEGPEQVSDQTAQTDEST